jgi:DNA-binding transcriptional LysR family regulator
MDLRLIEIFCCVYESLSFSRAAEHLHITQPTVSAHIKALEDHFGTSLFDRLGREIQPTRAAHILYEQSHSLASVRKNIENAMGRFLKKQEGRLELGASTIPGEYLLPRVIGQFHQKYPKIEVAISIGDTEKILEQVASGGIELGFVGAEPHSADMEASAFASDQLVLASPIDKRFPQGPITLAELKHLPLIVRERGSGTRKTFEQQLEQKNLHLRNFNVTAELGSTAAVKEAVMHDVGLAIISDLAIKQELHFKLLRTITIRDLPMPRRQFLIVHNKRRQRSSLCELMFDYILEHKNNMKE